MNNINCLSKSRYIKGLQCHKALWLFTHRPELREELSQAQQTTFDTGTDVGLLAQQLFPGGIEVPFEGLSLAGQVQRTHELIERGVETIFEAAFSYENVFVKADILHRSASGWLLKEVKSSTHVKDVFINDVAIQYYVLLGCGLYIDRAELVLIDTSYVRQGDVDHKKLFKCVDITADVQNKQLAIAQEIKDQRSMLSSPEPNIDIGPHCFDPYECEFTSHCFSHLPENSVFDFRDRGKPDTFELYRQGILRMEDVPSDQLGWRQQMQVDCLLNQSAVLKHDALIEFLAGLRWPLAFLDFETTYMTPVPLFDGTRPYEAVPFQFSLHIQEGLGDELHHHQFLSEDDNDPRLPFLEALLAFIPKTGSIVVWNRSFESNILARLAGRYPEKREHLLGLNDRMVDLMIPFRNRDYYHWQMNGSYSIKAVLPALVPEFSYDGLSICSGDVAASSWIEMIHTSDNTNKNMLRESLLNYCELDTLAMFVILKHIQSIIAV